MCVYISIQTECLSVSYNTQSFHLFPIVVFVCSSMNKINTSATRYHKAKYTLGWILLLQNPTSFLPLSSSGTSFTFRLLNQWLKPNIKSATSVFYSGVSYLKWHPKCMKSLWRKDQEKLKTSHMGFRGRVAITKRDTWKSWHLMNM